MIWAGVGNCLTPEEIWSRLSTRQWIEHRAYAKHFSTPQERADTNSALERQTTLALSPRLKEIPTLEDLKPKYGRTKKKKRRSPEELFRLAQADASRGK